VRECRYIAGDPKRGATFCKAPALEGKPWCAEHHALCTVPRVALTEREIASIRRRMLSANGAPLAPSHVRQDGEKNASAVTIGRLTGSAEGRHVQAIADND
jgi:hypothetical protein